MQENKILDLSIERKKREKEIEEARKKMKAQQNLKSKIKEPKKTSEFSDTSIEEKNNFEEKKSFQKLKWKTPINFAFPKFSSKKIQKEKIEHQDKIFSTKNESIFNEKKEKSKKQPTQRWINIMLKFCNFFISVPIYLLVFLIPIFFLPFTFEIFEFNKQYLLWFLTGIALIAWILKIIVIKKEFIFLRNPLNIFVLLLMIIYGIATFFSIDRYSSIWGTYGWFSGNFLETLSLGTLFFIIINNIKETSLSVNRLIKTFLISGFFVILTSYLSLFGILSKLVIKIPWLNNFLSGINLSNFNLIGSWETLSIFLIIFIVLILEKKSQNLLTSIIGCLLFIACLFLLIIVNFTLTWIILLIALGILFISKIKKIKNENYLKIYLIIITFIFCIISLFYPLNKFIKIDFLKEKRLDNKISWQITKDVIKNHPILGTGPSTFDYNFSQYYPKEFNQNENWQIHFKKSGNHISELISSIGILGILIYLILIGIFFTLVYRLSFIIYCLPVFLLFLIQFFYPGNTVLNFCFWLFFALSIVYWKKIKPEVFKTQKFGHKILKNIPEISIILNSMLVLTLFVFIGVDYFAIRNYKVEMFIKKQLSSQQKENFLDQKIETLKQASKLNPKQVYYQIALIQTYLDKILIESEDLKNQQSYEKIKITIDLAIQKIKDIQKIAPLNVKTAEIQGYFYKNIKNIVSETTVLSIEGFAKAVKLEPANPILHTELGKMYMDLAEENEEKNLEKPPKDSIKEENLFIKKLKETNSSELIKLGQGEFQKALELKQDFWPARLYLALSYEKQKNTSKAISDLENLIVDLNKNKQDQPEVFYELGKMYYNYDRIDDAIKAFEMAIQMAPNFSNALFGLAIINEKKESYNQALELFSRLQQLNLKNEGIKRKILELKEKVKNYSNEQNVK